jgi:predicted hotdog family 3-hydroxylacyl-ACP dehydratase
MQELLNRPVLDFIPQRPPFVLVDRIVECNEDFTRSEFTVQSEHLLCKDGFLQEGGLIENIAQTAAAGHGILMLSQGKEVVRGFIGSVKNLLLHKLPPEGTLLTTTVDNVSEVMNVNIVKGRVEDESGVLYAEGEMNIFLEN